MKKNTRLVLAPLAIVFTAATALYAADWPRFRGPDGNGVTDLTGLPTAWNATKNIAWVTPLPGPGASSPVVLGNKIFLTAYSGYGLDQRKPGDPAQLVYHLLCISATNGSILWDKKIPAKNPEAKYSGAGALHGYAAASPVVAADAVYATFGPNGVHAFDFSGKQLWEHNVGTKTHGWNSGASPILYGDLVIVNASVESGNLVALDRKTGRQKWSQPGILESWTTPIILKTGGRDELVVSVKNAIKAFAPQSGNPLWSAPGIACYVVPSPIQYRGVVYCTGGLPNATGLIAIKAGPGPNKRDDVYMHKGKGNNVSSPVYYENRIYFAHESRGVAFCFDATSGAIIYERPLTPKPGLIYASALLAEGRIYYASRENGVYVIEATREFKQIAHNVIETDKTIFNASPVPLTGGRLLLRSDKALYCIGR